MDQRGIDLARIVPAIVRAKYLDGSLDELNTRCGLSVTLVWSVVLASSGVNGLDFYERC